MEGVEVVADELVNDALHKRFKMILVRSLLSVLMQMERLLRNIANMFGSSYWGARMRIMYNFLNNFFVYTLSCFFEIATSLFCCCSFFVVKFTFSKRSSKNIFIVTIITVWWDPLKN